MDVGDRVSFKRKSLTAGGRLMPAIEATVVETHTLHTVRDDRGTFYTLNESDLTMVKSG